MRRRVLAAVLTAVAIAHAHAQAQPSSLPARLAPDTRAAIERLADSLRATGLPTSPLADKAAEGVLKGADDRRILAAVQSLARELGEARGALGASADVSLLVAGASALHAGASAADLRRIAHPGGADADPHVTMIAFVTLVDLVAKHVPVWLAAGSLGELAARRAPESQYVALRSEVEQDILGGRAPDAAITSRMRAHLRLLDDPTIAKPAISSPPRPPSRDR